MMLFIADKVIFYTKCRSIFRPKLLFVRPVIVFRFLAVWFLISNRLIIRVNFRFSLSVFSLILHLRIISRPSFEVSQDLLLPFQTHTLRLLFLDCLRLRLGFLGIRIWNVKTNVIELHPIDSIIALISKSSISSLSISILVENELYLWNCVSFLWRELLIRKSCWVILLRLELFFHHARISGFKFDCPLSRISPREVIGVSHCIIEYFLGLSENNFTPCLIFFEFQAPFRTFCWVHETFRIVIKSFVWLLCHNLNWWL